MALTPAFSGDPTKQTQWKAFLRRTVLQAATLEDVVDSISTFVVPMFEASHGGRTIEAWALSGPWTFGPTSSAP